ncbi:HTH-type transcriptional activator Btr [Novipirellula aureliae]|uniref:HTH-type transcriptional activator Btr n=1 Tax=Novipirellula aureliae TaxID=2527966 RepID=A0A5C6DAM1_9BACT|nr:AraC family transcriptional regulator [Novipirellula aureliae]TWU33175.1 HTH-type transcriptional activator Btr [Novipirellula aureliae]
MKPSFEKLINSTGESFRCFDRSVLDSPVKWHRHPEMELTYIPRGTGSRIVGDSISSYSDHDLVLIGSQLPHTWSSDEFRDQRYDRHQAYVLQFHPEFLGCDFFQCGEMAEIAEMFHRARRGLFFPADVAIPIGLRLKGLIETEGASRLIGMLEILNLLSQYSDATELASELYRVSPSANANRESETRIQIVCDYIVNHLSDPELTHRDLAELVDMNPSAFSRFFKQSTGRTLSAYIGELRIGLACRLLADTDGSILAVCYQSGFANLSNFNRRFRQLRNMTPRDYRTRFRVSV